MTSWLAPLGSAMCLLFTGAAWAQLPFDVPAAPAADGATLFRNQCGTCHTVEAGAPLRQGPNLAGIVGRRAGSLPGFGYSAAFAHAEFTWDEPHLQRWLTNPQSLLPGAVMLYSQPDPKIRQAIIFWLKEQH